MTRSAQSPLIILFARWLTLRRLRAQATVLALCLWGVCAVDFATPELFDRAGNVKFQDFLPFYISAQLIAQHRAVELYDSQTTQREMLAIVRDPTRVRLTYLYGPQVGLLFLPLAKLSFSAAARIWVSISVLIYAACIYALWRCCSNLRAYPGTVAIAALAFPPLFHFFVRGQFSPIILTCFVAAFLALRANRPWLAGIAFGCLILKPPFLVAIPLIMLLAQAWKISAALIASAAAQLALTRLYFGHEVMLSYLDLFQHPSRWLAEAELNLAPIQMHSLRSFWSLLISPPAAALVLYLLCSIAGIAIAVAIWKSPLPLPLRFSALTFAAVLVDPHLFIYDVLVLAPALLPLADWTLVNEHHVLTPPLRVLAYLAFILPLFGPISRWTHLQLSVVVFAALLWTLHRVTAGHKLALTESPVV
ncbi:MAG TPA: glycosyltransferase family 87 protein [Candidatus Sulfotelmatobacter sp.]|nr:glycosyltransferase family 87 protein [Candidatus Sulfotelmatobacter sp.]